MYNRRGHKMSGEPFRDYDDGIYKNFGEQPYIFELHIGYGLIFLLGNDDNNSLLREITYKKNKFDDEYGIPIPKIHIRDNMSLNPDEYQFFFNGLKAGEFKIGPNDFLCIDSGNVIQEPDVPFVRKTKDPSYNMDAFVVEKEYRDVYEKAGYVCVPTFKVIAEHYETILKKNRTKILDQCLVNTLAEKVRKINPDVYSDVFFKKTFSASNLKIILNYLLEEHVSIKDMNTILETIADYVDEKMNIFLLVEKIREKLALRIISRYVDEGKVVHVLIVSSDLCTLLNENICESDSKIEIPELCLDSEINRKLLKKISEMLSCFKEKHLFPILVCSHDIRLSFAKYIHTYFHEIPVFSETEILIIGKEFEVNVEGEISLDEESEENTI